MSIERMPVANVLSTEKQVAIIGVGRNRGGVRASRPPQSTKAYARAYKTDNPKKPVHVTVLHIEPVISPLLPVRAAIVEEFRRNAATEES